MAHFNSFDLQSYTFNRWTRNGYTSDVEQNEALYLGNLDSDPKGKYLEIPYTMYSDYSGGTVERANCQEFLELFGELVGVHPVYGGYGTTGVVIRRALLCNEEILEVLDGLENYPLINDESLSDLELELEGEAWSTWVEWGLQHKLDKAGISYDDTLQDTFYRVIRDNEIYFLHEDAVCPYIDLDEVVKHW